MLILRSNSFILNRRIVHLIPFFDLMYRKALDCVNSTQKKCKWKQHWSSHWTFVFFFSSNELSFPIGREEKGCYPSLHRSRLPPISPFSPSSSYIEHTFKKKFVKLDKRKENKYFFIDLKDKNTVKHDIHMNTLFDIEHWLNMSTSATSWSFILR